MGRVELVRRQLRKRREEPAPRACVDVTQQVDCRQARDGLWEVERVACAGPVCVPGAPPNGDWGRESGWGIGGGIEGGDWGR